MTKKDSTPEVDESVITAAGLCQFALETVLFGPEPIPTADGTGVEEVTAVPSTYTPGESLLVVVAGENGSGKSLFRRVICQIARAANVEAIHISLEGRADGGVIRAMVYGSEADDSTGDNSATTVVTGIRTCRSRENPHIIVWDEPDIGLSDGHAAGVGILLREFVENPGKHTRAVFVTSHNRHLLGQLVAAKPHFMCLGDERTETLEQWLARPVVPLDLEALSERCLARRRLVGRVLKAGRDE